MEIYCTYLNHVPVQYQYKHYTFHCRPGKETTESHNSKDTFLSTSSGPFCAGSVHSVCMNQSQDTGRGHTQTNHGCCPCKPYDMKNTWIRRSSNLPKSQNTSKHSSFSETPVRLWTYTQTFTPALKMLSDKSSFKTFNRTIHLLLSIKKSLLYTETKLNVD